MTELTKANAKMVTQKSPRLSGPPPPNKQRKVDGQSNDSAAVEETTAPIFNLIDDCCYALLDWLPYEDLRSFGQTCKWAQQIAADLYKMNHSAKECTTTSTSYFSGDDVFDHKNAQKLRVWCDDKLHSYRHIKRYCNKSMKQIGLIQSTLCVAKVNYLEKVLCTVERVKLEHCTISGDFYRNFLKFCSNVKMLRICSGICNNLDADLVLIGTDNGWLTQKYPTLERLEIFNSRVPRINELKTFFEQNPNVRSFATYASFLEGNLDSFRTTDIKLDQLAIKSDNKVKSMLAICGHLNNLHERGVFQRLHFVVWYNNELSEEVASLKALEKLSVRCWNRECATISSLLANIKELEIFDDIEESTMELTARNLVNVEHIFLQIPSLVAVVALIRYAAKLKKIKIHLFYQMPNKGNDGLDIAALNKDRQKLAGAKKVTIYVPEYVYLATKWATNQTSYSLIELKRENSYDWGEEIMYYT